MTLIYWLLAIGFVSITAVGIWCIVRLDDQTHHQRPTLDPLSVYLMEREVKRIVDEEYDIMEREKEWRR